jgi:hypothetical protein
MEKASSGNLPNSLDFNVLNAQKKAARINQAAF